MPDRSTCLLVIDMDTTYLGSAMAQMAQHGIDADYLRQRLQTVQPNIERLLAAYRAQESRVVFTVASAHFEDYADSGQHVRGLLKSWQCQASAATFSDELAPRSGEPVLHKGCSSVWNGTQLDYMLRAAQVSHLVIVGAMTNACVMLAATGGWDLGYPVTVVDDACVARGERYHEMALELMRYLNIQITSTAAIIDGDIGQAPSTTPAAYLNTWKTQLPTAHH